MMNFKGTISELPNYLDGSFLLFEIEHTKTSFPCEVLKKVQDEEIFYEELSLTDNVVFENEKREKKIKLKIRIDQDKDITSKNVLKIDEDYYQVFNIYHFKNKNGYLQSDLTLQEYPNPKLKEVLHE